MVASDLQYEIMNFTSADELPQAESLSQTFH